MKQPHILVQEGAINETVLLPGDPDRVPLIAQHLDSTEELTYNREYRVINGEYEGTPITVCSTGVGCPSAAVAVEELTKVGAETLVRVGTCGALQESLNVGDVVIPTAAAKFDGTTKRYEGIEYPAVPTLGVTNSLIETAKNQHETVYVGPGVSDDAFYSEDDIAYEWEEAGMLAVEMEASIIFTLARRRGVDSGAILTVDGNLVAGEQKGETEGDEELSKDAQEGVKREVRIAVDAVSSL